MNYWIFIVTEHKINSETFTAEEIFNQRMEDKFWGLGEKTPNRKNLTKGDKIIFYIGLPKKIFAGTATLASSSFKLNDDHKKNYGHGKQVYMADYGVLLENIEKWENPKNVEGLVPKLNFIENKEFWFSYFQGGVRQISEDDFNTIINETRANLESGITTSDEIKNKMEFALESQLEEFLYKNWSKIDWGSILELYKTDEQDGRQFPAGTWSIDFLAIDKNNNDLVVIELKRGKTSDSTVGQLLRYINWVKDNIAEKGQNVRGIIIAKDVDDALKYAVKNLDYIEVKTYEIDFQLLSVKK